jgi:hypothetical protein
MEYPHAPGLAARLFPSLILLAVISVLPSAAAEGAKRVYESGEGRLQIAVVAVAAAASPGAGNPAPSDASAPEPSGAAESPAAEPPAAEPSLAAESAPEPTDACLSADFLGDIASPAGICRSGDALLDVDFYDKAAMRELRFPLKYSELRRYLLKHPLAYREGTAEERAIRLIADLARHLRIEMREPALPEEKP